MVQPEVPEPLVNVAIKWYNTFSQTCSGVIPCTSLAVVMPWITQLVLVDTLVLQTLPEAARQTSDQDSHWMWKL